jgi:hypothetical protein
MGYAGRVEDRELARSLRASGWTVPAIAVELQASKSTVSRWVADVPFTPGPRHRGGPTAAHPMHLARLRDEADAAEAAGVEIGALSERDLMMVGLALYAGEGAKTGNAVRFANTDERWIRLFLQWLRTSFDLDESRFRIALYLHEGLDLDAAIAYWSEVCSIPPGQFTRPYRAAANPTRRVAKHPMGCPSVRYADARVFRRVLAGVDALHSIPQLSGIAQLAERSTVNRIVAGSIPAPGAT